jgi:hypothetical protein
LLARFLKFLKDVVEKIFGFARENQFAKLVINNASIVKDNINFYLKPENCKLPIVIIHPEHGVLTLDAKEFEIFSCGTHD